jgi:MoaA/NifB/PqqE/SkfB family radical SAM enzyme
VKINASKPDEIETFRRAWKKAEGYRLQQIKFYVTKRCNLSCKMCGGGKNSKDPELDDILRVIREGRDLGLQEVKLFGGEPFLRNDLEQFIGYCTNIGIYTTVSTNGILLTSSRISKILDAGLRKIVFSLDSPYRETHDAIRGANGVYDKITDNIRQLADEAKRTEKSIDILINMVLLKENYTHLPKLIMLAGDLGATQLSVNPATPNKVEALDEDSSERSLFESLTLSPEEARHYTEEVLPHALEVSRKLGVRIDEDRLRFYGEKGEIAEKNPPFLFLQNHMENTFCLKPFYYAIVNENLELVACNRVKSFSYPIGSLKEKRLKELWNSGRYRNFRWKIKRGFFKECQICCYPYFLMLEDMTKKLGLRHE